MTIPNPWSAWRRRTIATRRWLIVALASLMTFGATAVTVGTRTASAATVNTATAYVFVNRHSGKALDLWEWSTANGAPVNQFTRNDLAVQQWRFVDVGSGYYQITSVHSGKVLELPSSTDGVQLIQNPADGGQQRQHFRLADSAGGYVRFINRSSGKALDVWEWSTADGAKVSQFQDLDGWNQQWQLVPLGSGPTNPPTGNPPGNITGLVGWATQNGGTTGGGNAAVTNVSSASALSSALGSSGAAVIRVTGNISCSGMLRVRSNKTILGNGSATISGCGFTINGDRNVIIRNLRFNGWDDDAVNVEGSATNVWIDHNTFGRGFDGAVDIKRGSDFITVSWNRVDGQDKSFLLGHSDSNGGQDTGHLRTTYHHNWFNGSNQRHPRVRFANPVHVYNNYYANVGGYGVASTENAGVLVEGNYFENTPDPFHRGEADSGPGGLAARNNHFVNSGPGQTGGSVAAIPYPYTLDTASAVKGIVTGTGGAGAGRITV